MTANEAPSEDSGTQDRSAFPRAWVKPLLIALSILGGLVLNGLITGLVYHFTVTVPTVRALERARLSLEASVNAQAKELEAVVRAIAPKPTPSIDPVTAVQEAPPAAEVAPVAPAKLNPAPSMHPPHAAMVPVRQAQPGPVTSTLPPSKAKPNPDSHLSKAPPPLVDPNK